MKTIIALLATVFLITMSNAQIETGMIAHFPFNGDYDDISTSSIAGVNYGCAFGLDRNGAANYAIELDGTSNYVGLNSSSVKVSLPISISVWVKINTIGSLFSPIFYTDSEFNNYSGYCLGLSTTGRAYVQLGGNLGTATSSNRRTHVIDDPLSVGNWHHIVAKINNYDDVEIYVDCQLMPGTYSGNGPTTMVFSNTESRIGGDIGSGSAPNGAFFEGSIDQLAIWNRELTSAEVTLLCDTNNPLEIAELEESSKELVKIVDLMGRETQLVKNTPLIYIYSDGSSERIFVFE